MSGDKGFKVWDKLVDKWPEEKAETGFSDDEHLSRDVQKMAASLEACERKSSDINVNVYSQYPLPVMISLLSQQKKLSVLDFGGGLGQTYLAIKATNPNLSNLSYYILEFGARAKAGEKLFVDEPCVEFISSFDLVPNRVDIVFSGSTLQYIKDWKAMIKKLCSYNSEYLVFGDLIAGDNKPCIAMQNYWEHKIPMHFFNLSEVVSEIEMYGFDLIFDSYYQAMFLGKKQPLPTDHFPAEHKLDFGRNVIFKKKQT